MENKFIVEQKSLLAILSSMQPICTKRTTLDATSTILFQVGHKELVLKGTDLEISLQSSYALKDSDVTEPRSFLVSGRRIFDLVKELEADITFCLDDQQLRLTSGAVNLALNIKDPADFPPFPERIENLMQIDSPFLLDMLNKVAFLILTVIITSCSTGKKSQQSLKEGDSSSKETTSIKAAPSASIFLHNARPIKLFAPVTRIFI